MTISLGIQYPFSIKHIIYHDSLKTSKALQTQIKQKKYEQRAIKHTKLRKHKD